MPHPLGEARRPNGVCAGTGQFLGFPDDLATIARREEIDEPMLKEVRYLLRRRRKTFLGVKEGVKPTLLSSAGWGVIFAHNADPAVREALQPLLAHRASQAGEHYREYAGPKKGYRTIDPDAGYATYESKSHFLARHGVGPGEVDPKHAPYYMLLVGDPSTIPFRFQSELDLQYAVGRIAFDTPEDYANYARTVVQAEERTTATNRRVVFFGTETIGDDATTLSARELVRPLAAEILPQLPLECPAWTVDPPIVGDGRATKPALADMLGGSGTPAVLFAACHGVKFENGENLQVGRQGALLCQEWAGPDWKGAMPEDWYFCADDLSADRSPFGLIAFFASCYGAGTPQHDSFATPDEVRRAIAPHPFLAALPKRLLAHPSGGALAVVSHVDRLWGDSFYAAKVGPRRTTFESTLLRILKSEPVGWAMELFGHYAGERADELASAREEERFGATIGDEALIALLTAWADARSFVILGDPAVRAAV